MRVGDSKNRLFKGGRYSCLTRDEAYARMNDKFLGMIGVELDIDFADIEDFRRRALATGLPWLPQLVVSLPVPGPEIVRPHLFFQLPHDMAVWNDASNPLCRTAPRSLYRAVARGLTDLLMTIGADPRTLSNPLHWKNPLSPRWNVAVLDSPVCPTLSMWAQARRCDGSKLLNLGVSQEQLLRAKAAGEASRIGQDPTWSNSLFSETRSACFAQVASWKACDDPRYRFGVVDRRDRRLSRGYAHAQPRHLDPFPRRRVGRDHRDRATAASANLAAATNSLPPATGPEVVAADVAALSGKAKVDVQSKPASVPTIAEPPAPHHNDPVPTTAPMPTEPAKEDEDAKPAVADPQADHPALDGMTTAPVPSPTPTSPATAPAPEPTPTPTPATVTTTANAVPEPIAVTVAQASTAAPTPEPITVAGDVGYNTGTFVPGPQQRYDFAAGRQVPIPVAETISFSKPLSAEDAAAMKAAPAKNLKAMIERYGEKHRGTRKVEP